MYIYIYIYVERERYRHTAMAMTIDIRRGSTTWCDAADHRLLAGCSGGPQACPITT